MKSKEKINIALNVIIFALIALIFNQILFTKSINLVTTCYKTNDNQFICDIKNK